MSEENVKVAVRVRPFNDREKARKATLIIEMRDGRTTLIRDPANMSSDPKQFTFDFSYWSHDGFKTRADGGLEKDNPKYSDQVQKIIFGYRWKHSTISLAVIFCRCKFLTTWAEEYWKMLGKVTIVVCSLTVKLVVANRTQWLVTELIKVNSLFIILHFLSFTMHHMRYLLHFIGNSFTFFLQKLAAWRHC